MAGQEHDRKVAAGRHVLKPIESDLDIGARRIGVGPAPVVDDLTSTSA